MPAVAFDPIISFVAHIPRAIEETVDSIPRRIDEILETISSLPRHITEGIDFLRTASWEEILDNQYVQVALVVGAIALSCLVFPVIANIVNGVVLSAFGLLMKPVYLIFSQINTFLPTFSPLVQVAISIATLGIGSLLFDAMRDGLSSYLNSSNTFVLWLVPKLLFLLALPFREPCLRNHPFGALGKNSLFKCLLIAPIFEEIFFRYLLPPVFRFAVRSSFFIASFIANHDYSSTAERVIQKTQNIVNAWLFGIAHFHNQHRDRLSQALQTGFTSLRTFFPAFQRSGLGGAIAAHMANNIYATILWYLIDKVYTLARRLFSRL